MGLKFEWGIPLSDTTELIAYWGIYDQQGNQRFQDLAIGFTYQPDPRYKIHIGHSTLTYGNGGDYHDDTCGLVDGV